MTARKNWFFWHIASMLLSLLLLGACSAKDKTMTLGITGYNYSKEGVAEYYVSGNRGSNLPSYGGGGSTSCCISLPSHWTPEVRVEIDADVGHWTIPYEKRQHMTVQEQIDCCVANWRIQKTVPVQPYKDNAGGVVQVFFLPDDQIEVWVSPLSVLHPDHPSKRGYPKNPNPPKESP